MDCWLLGFLGGLLLRFFGELWPGSVVYIMWEARLDSLHGFYVARHIVAGLRVLTF